MPLFFISDYAFLHLTAMGQKLQFIGPSPQRVNGMSKFLTKLAKEKFIDTRPPLVIRRHNEEIIHNHAPSWVSRYPRRQRRLTISDEAMADYVRIALQVGIIMEEPYPIGGPSRLSMIPITSSVLEGIGLRWITPSYDVHTEQVEEEKVDET